MLDFDLHQLEYFVCAADAGSYSRAARELFVTPQAISHSIQLLETRVGAQLFERTPGGIALTAFGSSCLEPAREALSRLRTLQDTIDDLRRDINPVTVLGIHSLCFSENGGSINRNDLLAFQKRHGARALSFVEMAGNTIVNSLLQGSIDFGIGVLADDEARGLTHRFLKGFPIAALVSSRFPGHFAQSDGFVTIEELTRGELVSFADETAYNDFLKSQARRAGHELPTSSLQIRPGGDMGFIATSMLYVIRPLQHALRTVHDDRIAILPIRDADGEELRMPLGILMRAGRGSTAFDKSLIAFIQKNYR